MPQTSLAVSARLIMPHLAAISKKIGFRPRKTLLTTYGMPLDAFIFKNVVEKGKVTKRFMKNLKRIGKTTMTDAMLGDNKLPLLLPKAAEVKITDLSEINEPDKLKKAFQAIKVFKPHLELLARATGRPVILHMNSEEMHPPFPENDPAIHIIAGANPPGEFCESSITEVFGLPIDPIEQRAKVRSPTRGRGNALCDNKGIPVVQLIATTAYPLIPLYSYFLPVISEGIFRHILALVAKALYEQAGVKAKAEVKNFQLAPIMKIIQSRGSIIKKSLNDHLKDINRDIQNTEKALATYYINKAHVLGLLKLCDEGEIDRNVQNAREAVLRLRRNPLVENIYACDVGIHMDTRPIIAEHEGATHNLGTFTVRISSAGQIFIWGRETTHPDGIPHPHLPKYGTPCFGTATEGIVRAGAELRFYDALDMVLRWLKDGYTPHLARNLITEWPLAKKEGGK